MKLYFNNHNELILGEDWDILVNFTKKLNWTLLFDLNQFYRTNSGDWDLSNAETLFKDTVERHPNARIMWQLGNGKNIIERLMKITFIC